LLGDKLQQLNGPPRLVSLYIKSSAEFNLKSINNLVEHWDEWDEIKRGANVIYRESLNNSSLAKGKRKRKFESMNEF
jgi:hypothetical protein